VRDELRSVYRSMEFPTSLWQNGAVHNQVRYPDSYLFHSDERTSTRNMHECENPDSYLFHSDERTSTRNMHECETTIWWTATWPHNQIDPRMQVSREVYETVCSIYIRFPSSTRKIASRKQACIHTHELNQEKKRGEVSGRHC
jgi:hypothetical protein